MRDNVVKVLGLITQYNPLTTAPGALVTADDCVNRRQNILEDRRGYKSYATKSNNVSQYFQYNSTVLVHNGTKLSYDSDGGGTFADYSGSYTAPSGYKSRGIEAFSNLYMTTSKGVQVFEDVAGTAARYAGVPRALDISYSLNSLSSGFLGADYQCAYRSVIKKTDSNSNVIPGYPSQRLVALNPNISITGDLTSGSSVISSVSSLTDVIDGMSIAGTGITAGTTVTSTDASTSTVTCSANVTSTASTVDLTLSASRDIDIVTYLPSECVAGDIIQFYRTTQISGTASDSSGDEEGLVYQQTLSSTDISNGYVSFTDSITDSLIGATIYTAPSQEGIRQASERPPLAKDLALYKNNFMFYANTSTKERLSISLVGTGSLTGNTITVAGTTYNFGATEIISGAGAPQVKVGSTGITASDIDSTARSLCKVINRYASNTSVYAYYLSGPDDLPGQIMIEERGIGGSAFSVTASVTGIASDFFPQPPTSGSATASTSSNSVQKNAIYYSKTQQPEAVPTLNYLFAGEANKNILRIAPLKDSLIIIKEEGVYRMTGLNPASFVVDPLDLTVKCKAIDSVVVLSNVVYMLSNQGVVAISENGVQVISEDIQNTFLPLLQNANISTTTYGIAYESEHEYLISLPSSTSETAATQTFVFNMFTRTWVRWTFAIACGIIEASADKLYFSKPSSAVVYAERKSFTDDDFADPEFTATITDITGDVVTFTLSGTTPVIGWGLKQGTTTLAIQDITSVGTTYTATMDQTPPSSWAAGSATLYPSVNMNIEWNAWTAEAPSMLKQIRAAAVLADDINAYNTVSRLIATFRTNFDVTKTEVAITQSGEGWGGTWGSSPWGGEGDSFGYPTWVPMNKQYCTRMYMGVKHQNALERLSIAGISFEFDVVSEEVGR